MIQFILNHASAPDMLELRTSAAGSDAAAKPPIVVHRDLLQNTLRILLRAAQMEAV